MGDAVVNQSTTTPPICGPTPAPTAPEPLCTAPADSASGAPTALRIGDSVAANRSGEAATSVDLVSTHPTDAVPDAAKPQKQSPHPKGTIFGSYGYNRDNYTNSTVHFTGNGYDFTFHDVSAQDKPSFGGSLDQWAREVLHTHIDIPQTNYKFGYFITDNTSISVAQDHMKYHMRPQDALVTGTVSPEASQQFAGTYNGMTPVGSPGTIVSDLQHCDGLNFMHVELAHFVPIVQTQNGNAALEAYGSVGVGAYVTDTRANVFSETADGGYDGGTGPDPNANTGGWTSQLGSHDTQHTHSGFVLDGFGASAGAGVRATFFKHMYIEGGVKTGFASLHGFHTIDAGRGAQNIGWLQRDIAVGVQFPLGQHKQK